MEFLGVFQVFILLILCTKYGFSCSSDSDCSYGGVCDKVLRRCTCNLACSRFTKPKLVCAGKKLPQPECKALNMACEKQQNIVLSPYNPTVFRKTRNCKKMVAESIEEFCKDQTICSGNGICLVRVGQTQPFCRCVENYSGDRCHIKSPKLMPVADGGDTDAPGHDGNTVGSGRSMNYTDPAPYVAAAFVTCAIAACIVFYLRRRSVNSTEGNKHGDVESEIDTINETKRSTPIVVEIQTTQERICTVSNVEGDLSATKESNLNS